MNGIEEDRTAVGCGRGGRMENTGLCPLAMQIHHVKFRLLRVYNYIYPHYIFFLFSFQSFVEVFLG